MSDEDTLEGRIQQQITDYKKRHDMLVEEQQELAATRDELRDMTLKFRERTNKLVQAVAREHDSYKEQLGKEKAKLQLLAREEKELLEEIRKVEAALDEEEAELSHLRERANVLVGVPERAVVFTGETGQATDAPSFTMEPRIVYPMDGGTALLTFEEKEVAQRILKMQKHRVGLGEELYITLEARPVKLRMPSLVEIDSGVCPRSILISNLPRMEREMLLNKLEIHFSKSKYGGGEVEECLMLPDSETVVLTFLKENIAEHLIAKEFHDVHLLKQHRVRVTPYLNGTITNLETRMSVCPRTVLLTGIPAIEDRENLQDMLEIHFQMDSNGGGELEALLYNPLGERFTVLFEVDAPRQEEKAVDFYAAAAAP